MTADVTEYDEAAHRAAFPKRAPWHGDDVDFDGVERRAEKQNASALAQAVTPRAALLREAEELITGDRNETYGTPTQNFANIAALWNIQFGHMLKPGVSFTGAHVAQAQIHVKQARMIAQPKRDNYLDIAGYAACGWEAQANES